MKSRFWASREDRPKGRRLPSGFREPESGNGAGMTRGGLNRREAFAPRAAAAGDRGAAAFGAGAGKEPVLAFAADFGRLILAFHKF